MLRHGRVARVDLNSFYGLIDLAWAIPLSKWAVVGRDAGLPSSVKWVRVVLVWID